MNPKTTTPDPLSTEGAIRMDLPSGEGKPKGPAAARALPDDAMILLPVRNVVLFPGIVSPITIGRERSRAAVQEAVRLERPVGILLQSKPEVDAPTPDDLHWVGTTASVMRYITTEGAHHAIVCRAEFDIIQ